MPPGPAVNVAIAIALLLWLGPQRNSQNLTQIENPAASLAVKLAGANIMLVLFNLIPGLSRGWWLRVARTARHVDVRARLSSQPGSGKAWP
jgi:hypothetical protein